MRLVALLAFLIATASCASARGGSGARTAHVSIKSFAFDPDKLEISLGDTVEWVNNDSFTHSAVGDSKSFDTGNIPGDERRTFVPKAKGEWPYHCSWHPNMRATLVVK